MRVGYVFAAKQQRNCYGDARGIRVRSSHHLEASASSQPDPKLQLAYTQPTNDDDELRLHVAVAVTFLCSTSHAHATGRWPGVRKECVGQWKQG